MTKTREVHLTGSVLRWAREEAGVSREDLANKLKTTPSAVSDWEAGSAYPSRGQFTKIAEFLRRPSSIFFLPTPPARKEVPPAFRNAPGLKGHRLNREEVQEIRWARRIQSVVSWIREQASSSEGQSGLSEAKTTTDATLAGEAERSKSEITFAEQLQWQSAGEAFRFWRSYLEEQNVLVFQLSLGKNGIRGFSAWDELAPVVAVNTAYHPTARVYTLFHELAHLHLRQDSACFSFFDSDSDPKVERWCEAFAAGYLLPRIAVEDAATRLYGVGKSSPADDPDLVRRMANRFNVSARALTIRLQQLQMAPAGLYERLVEELDSIDWNVAGGGGGGGMTSPEKRVSQLGTAAPLALVSAYDGGSITARDLSSYLNLTTNDVGDLRALLTSAAVDEIA